MKFAGLFIALAFLSFQTESSNAQLFKKNRCPKAPRCGFLAVTMHSVDATTQACTASCVKRRATSSTANKALTCGACPSAGTASTPVATTPVATSPSTPTTPVATPTTLTAVTKAPVAPVPAQTPVKASTPTTPVAAAPAPIKVTTPTRAPIVAAVPGPTPTAPTPTAPTPTATAPQPGLNGGFKKPTAAPFFAPNYVPPTRPAVNGPFSIQLHLAGLPTNDAVYFTNSKARWESVLTSELQDFTTKGLASAGEGCVYPETVDELYICAKYDTIDGGGLVIGNAGPQYHRDDGTAAIGSMTFDIEDVTSLKENGSFGDTVLHEMGHVLGIGTSWKSKKVTGDDTEDTACPYVGVHANKEYLAVSGCSRVPTEQEASKGQCAHWDDTCLVDELMTGSLLQGSKAILSRITVASLQDLGYSVDYTQADTYTKDNLGPNCACKTRKERSLLDMRHGETVPLGRLRAPTKNKSTPVRRLSAQAHQMAMEYGQSLLSQRSATLKDEQRRILQRGDNNDTTGSGNSLVYVGDQVVSVLVQDGGHAYGVIVHKTP